MDGLADLLGELEMRLDNGWWLSFGPYTWQVIWDLVYINWCELQEKYSLGFYFSICKRKIFFFIDLLTFSHSLLKIQQVTQAYALTCDFLFRCLGLTDPHRQRKNKGFLLNIPIDSFQPCSKHRHDVHIPVLPRSFWECGCVCMCVYSPENLSYSSTYKFWQKYLCFVTILCSGKLFVLNNYNMNKAQPCVKWVSFCP